MENGVIKVVSPIDDTPASKAGILPGDLIFASGRRAGAGPHPAGSGREDARPGRHADQGLDVTRTGADSRATSR
jgi:hypothetical protein